METAPKTRSSLSAAYLQLYESRAIALSRIRRTERPPDTTGAVVAPTGIFGLCDQAPLGRIQSCAVATLTPRSLRPPAMMDVKLARKLSIGAWACP